MQGRAKSLKGSRLLQSYLGACIPTHDIVLDYFQSYGLGTAPTQEQFILGVLLRAIYNHIILIIQLLLSGGSIQVMV